MRRTAAALAMATFGLVTVVTPFADAQAASGTEPIRCGTDGPPVCDALEDLQAQLAPLQPVLALAGPVAAGLGADVQDLLAQSESEQGVSSAEVLAGASEVDSVLDLLPPSIRTLLGGTALGQLDDALDAISAALAPVTEPVLGKPTATEGSKPTVMRPAPSSSSSNASGAMGYELDDSDLDSGSTAATSSLPDVPDGDVLDLGPLALPDFGWSSEMPTPAPTSAAAPDEVAQIAAAAAQGPFEHQGPSTAVVVVLFSALLGAAAVGSQWWQTRKAAHTIPD